MGRKENRRLRRLLTREAQAPQLALLQPLCQPSRHRNTCSPEGEWCRRKGRNGYVVWNNALIGKHVEENPARHHDNALQGVATSFSHMMLSEQEALCEQKLATLPIPPTDPAFEEWKPWEKFTLVPGHDYFSDDLVVVKETNLRNGFVPRLLFDLT